MVTLFRNIIRTAVNRLGYGLYDLRKDQWPGFFLPGHLRAKLQAHKINLVIDVGANTGSYASMIRAAGFEGRIISLEPVSDTFHQLEQNASQDQSWLTLNLALGDEDETRNINVCTARDLSSFLTPSKDMNMALDNFDVTRTETVTLKRLDSIFNQLAKNISEPRVLLKLDTQGYDLNVIRGATSSLRNVKVLQSELSVIPLYDGMPTYLDSLAHYRSLGFEPTAFFPVVHDRSTGHLLEMDVIFTRRSSPEAASFLKG